MGKASWNEDGKKIFADLRGHLRNLDASKGYLLEETEEADTPSLESGAEDLAADDGSARQTPTAN